MGSKADEKLSPEAQLLDSYMDQYKHCINVKKTLERRAKEIRYEFNHPLSGMKYDGMPHGSSIGLGCASLSFRMDEIERKIQAQIECAEKALMDIWSFIDVLPENSMERTIIEHKYIDRYSWEKICRTVHLTKTPAIRWWRQGLYTMLENGRVKMILEDFRKRREGEK